MRVLLVNNLFQPEPNHLKGLAFAKELKRRGHDVHVLTGFPNYPGGKVYPGYRMRWTAREELEGIPITRVAMYPSHDASTARRIANYVSLGASQAMHAPFLRTRFDVCHVYLGPLTLMWPALFLRAIGGAKILADVQDLWPESVTHSGMIRSGLAARCLELWCRGAYRSADRLAVLSSGYKRALVAQGVDPARIEVVYNWCDERVAPAAGLASDVLVPGAFNVVYAGNLGKLQGLDTLLDSAKRFTSDRRVQFTVIGDGVERDRLRRRVSDEDIANVRMVGRMPVQETNAVLKAADLLVIHVHPTGLTELGIPQKVQAYLAAGAPVLLAARGDAAELLERSRGGVTCAPGNPAAMADAIARVRAMDDGARREMGRSGRRFYEAELSFERGVDRIEAIFRDLAERGN